MATTIYLVRHAQYDTTHGVLPGRLPVPLSEVGKKEVEILRRFFVDKAISHIYSSAVLRCQQTAQAISNQRIPVSFDQRLLEGISAFQGYWVADHTQFYGNRAELGGENFSDIRTRVADFFHSTHWEDGKSYIICSHGDPLYFLFQEMINAPQWSEDQQTPAIVAKDYQKKASVRVMSVDSDKSSVVQLLTQEDLQKQL